MMKKIKYILPAVMTVIFFSCSQLEPEIENNNTFKRVLNDPNWTDGLLINGYSALPYNDNNPFPWDEVATDDAVNNQPTNNFRRMSNGNWTSSNNPEDTWTSCNRGIMYINEFLSLVDTVNFYNEDPLRNMLYRFRLSGEAYALRGALKYYLLRNHGGISTDGTLLGTPIYNEFSKNSADFNKPRDTFEDCVNSANADFDKALSMLPYDYRTLGSTDEIPDILSELKTGTPDQLQKNLNAYNIVFGNAQRQRISGRIALAFQVRLALLHASPAFNLTNDVNLWKKVADLASKLLKGVTLDPQGNHYFSAKDIIDNCTVDNDLSEFVWRRVKRNSNNMESANFPPSLQGQGQINPTQNFVDAFPMANGYPITNSASGYNPQYPYNGRDPRFYLTVIYNGCAFKNLIYTYINSGIDALNFSQTATRTGYYLRKFLRDDVLVGDVTNTKFHLEPFIRYTEIFLTYAEAANEAYGPEGDPNGLGYNAKSIIGDIRKRAGITSSDPYLASITTKEAMRTMIQNERRLELCFEGFRFWDLRRWKSPLVTQTVKGIRIVSSGAYTIFDVEPRSYQDYMMYGPIPYSEILKYKFIQNNGW